MRKAPPPPPQKKEELQPLVVEEVPPPHPEMAHPEMAHPEMVDQFPSPEPFEGEEPEAVSPGAPSTALEAIDEFRRSHGPGPLYGEEDDLLE